MPIRPARLYKDAKKCGGILFYENRLTVAKARTAHRLVIDADLMELTCKGSDDLQKAILGHKVLFFKSHPIPS